jgi:pimeloyl-ACP methyl ester carboxylesterase
MATQFFTAKDDTKIAYDVSGEGPALMLLHGAGRTRKDWQKAGYLDRLAQDYKIINIDIRGSGESGCPTRIEDYAIQTIFDDLEGIAVTCGVERYRVWGFSFGGNIARYLGAWSNRVEAIAIIGVPFGPAVHPYFDQYIDTFIEKYGPLVEDYEKETLSEKKRKSAIKGRIPVWVACFRAMRTWPRIDAEDVSCPKLLVVGTNNKPVVKWVKANENELIGAEVQVELIEGLTHSQEFSEIDLVYPVIRKFLDYS